MAAPEETSNNTDKPVGFASITMPVYLVLSLLTPVLTAAGLYYGMSTDIALVNKDIVEIQKDLKQADTNSTNYRTLLQKDIISTIDVRILELKSEIAISNSKSFDEFRQTLSTVRQDIQQMQFTINQIDSSYQTVKLDQQDLQERIQTIEAQLHDLKLELARIESTRTK